MYLSTNRRLVIDRSSPGLRAAGLWCVKTLNIREWVSLTGN